jgi:hypothetical protein
VSICEFKDETQESDITELKLPEHVTFHLFSVIWLRSMLLYTLNILKVIHKDSFKRRFHFEHMAYASYIYEGKPEMLICSCYFQVSEHDLKFTYS